MKVNSPRNDSVHLLFRRHNRKGLDKWESYFRIYDTLFAPYRDKEIRLLEIGVQNGGSLEVWSEYFSNALKIIGCDINPKCGDLTFDSEKIAVVVGDVVSDEVVSQLFNMGDGYDIIRLNRR